jgi:tetratricopeptide (TPR) repeat protein
MYNITSAAKETGKEELLNSIRYYVNKADALDNSNKKRVEFFTEASKLSRSYIEKYPSDEDGYAYLAYSLGSIIKNAPFYKKASLTKEVKIAATKALQINPNNSVALFISGMINRQASEISGIQRTMAKQMMGDVIEDASFEKAVLYFRKAVEQDSNNIQYLYELAKTYEDMGQTTLAYDIYKKILKLEPKNEKDKRYLNKAKKKLN